MNAYTNKDLTSPSPNHTVGRKRPRTVETSTARPAPFQIEWFPSDECKEDNNANNSNNDDDDDSSVHLNAKVTFLKNNPVNNNSVKLSLMGRAQLKCIRGVVEILGYQLDPSHDKVPVESPPWSSLLVFEPKISGEEQQGEEGAIIQIESWWPQKAENHNEPTFELVQSSSPGVRPTIIPSTWEHAMDIILPQLQPEESKPAFLRNALEPEEEDDPCSTGNNKQHFCMAICGAKSVGKSTFLRYATNRMLHDTNNSISRVAILDADVGQPEMSPPGMVTLTIVSEPFWTPPHYRSMANIAYEQQYSYFFGSTTSKNDPTRYISMVKKLQQHYEQDVADKDIPLLVNLDGWVKGLGYELLTALLTEVLNPTHVVQIVGTTKSKQFQLREVLNPETSSAQLHVVYSYDSTLNITLDPQAQTNGTSGKLNGVTNATAVATPQVPISIGMPAHALRSLRLCTYFLNDVTIWYYLGFSHDGIGDDTCEIANRLTATLPYAVPFEAVDILWEGSDHFSDLCRKSSAIHADLILDALNARIVGLCCRPTVESATPSQDDDCFPCIGLGLIRSIDREKRLFYILTPVESQRLKDVNILVGGTIDMPMEFCYRGVHAEAFPYHSLAPASVLIGADPMKSRNNIARKSLNK